MPGTYIEAVAAQYGPSVVVVEVADDDEVKGDIPSREGPFLQLQ